MKKILGIINSNSPAIQAIASVVIAVFAIFSFFNWVTSNEILNQQKRTEGIQFRSYVSMVSTDIKQSVPLSNPNYPLSIHYGFKNSGFTPAKIIKITTFDTINGKTVNLRTIGASPDIIGPGQITYIYQDVSGDYLDSILSNSGNFNTLEISYQDYLGNNHSLISRLVSQKGPPGFVATLGVLSQIEN